MNYWKPYENGKKGEKKLIVTHIAKQYGARMC
jgi:hypothetical protein